jgi:hypothetical protein
MNRTPRTVRGVHSLAVLARSLRAVRHVLRTGCALAPHFQYEVCTAGGTHLHTTWHASCMCTPRSKNNSQMFTQYTQSLHTFITKEWYYIIVKRRYADSTATIAQPSEPKAVGEANATDE